MPGLSALQTDDQDKQTPVQPTQSTATVQKASPTEGKLSASVEIRSPEILLLDDPTRYQTRAIIVKVQPIASIVLIL